MRALRYGLVGVTGVLAARWAVRDYRDWRGLGPGGLPVNPAGWLVATVLRCLGRDPFTVAGAGGPVSPALRALPARTGARPAVAPHPVPHRARDQHSPPAMAAAAQEILDTFAARPGVAYRTSGWEKHTPALYHDGGTEFAHRHPADGSLHVVLAPADAQHVVDLGWGELHPLAGAALRLPPGYTLLYPPRADADLDPLRAVLAAAADHREVS